MENYKKLNRTNKYAYVGLTISLIALNKEKLGDVEVDHNIKDYTKFFTDRGYNNTDITSVIGDVWSHKYPQIEERVSHIMNYLIGLSYKKKLINAFHEMVTNNDASYYDVAITKILKQIKWEVK